MNQMQKNKNQIQEQTQAGIMTHVSPHNRANLVKSYKYLGMIPLMPARFGGNRWLAHLSRAVDQHLDQVSPSFEKVF